MHRPRSALAALAAAAAFATAANAQGRTGAAAPAPARDFAVRCGTLLLGDGAPARHDLGLTVKVGKVQGVGTTCRSSMHAARS
jgi:hypothetical protein